MITLVRAAAGCGKTTALALRWLEFLAQGVPADRAIAVTFTRRAAAELVERVGLALHAVIGGERGEAAQRALGSAWPTYAAAAPSDPAVAEAALHALPTAPIGTTDAFVATLLNEHAVEACLPLPGGGSIPLDVPIRAGRGPETAFTRVARRLLDPADDSVPPEVALLARHFTLEQVRERICARSASDHLPMLSCRGLLDAVAVALADVVRAADPSALFDVADPADPAAWQSALGRATNQSGTWTVPRIAAWLAAGLPDPPPWELAAWLHALDRRGRRKAFKESLHGIAWDLRSATLTLGDVVDALRYPYEDPAAVDLADALREAREALRVRVAGEGLAAAARAGELDYDALCTAATALCERPPPALASRYGALLVDEVQDANPLQIRLYRALAALPGVRDRACFVGDVRQGIYLFRGADPHAFAELVSASEPGASLETNYRSTPALVEAHRGLFRPLAAALAARHIPPLESLEQTAAWSFNRQHELSPTFHAEPSPVWLVSPTDGSDADELALDAFLERLAAAWDGEQRPDTAAVLAPTWAAAHRACERIRRWRGSLDAARIEGGSRLLYSRTADDVRFFVRALSDLTDDVAWLAVWRHPVVGLSDHALAIARAASPLGELAVRERLPPGCLPADCASFDRAIGPLRLARRLAPAGRLAEGLDAVASALGWRALDAAAPDGEPGRLDALLDHVRELEVGGADAAEVLLGLSADHSEGPHEPVVDRPYTVVCTTIHQAKGLAWDHVLVWAPGRETRGGDPDHEPDPLAVTLPGLPPARLVGLRFDPQGGLSPFKDPPGRLLSAIHRRRRGSEAARMLYVAITRARRSVTLGLRRPRRAIAGRPPGVEDLVVSAWSAPGFAPTGVARLARRARPETGAAVSGWVAARGEVGDPPPPPPPPWQERSPSDSHHEVDLGRRRQQAEAARFQALLGGLHPGVGARLDPPAIPGWTAADWGTLAHGWMATWRFAGSADVERIAAWLAEERGPGVGNDAAAAWLASLSARMPRSPWWALVADPKARLEFERPFVASFPDTRHVSTGRLDLVVTLARRTWIVDFKVGGGAPSRDDPAAGNLAEVVPQLEAYRDALVALGRPIAGMILWYLRTGTTFHWS